VTYICSCVSLKYPETLPNYYIYSSPPLCPVQFELDIPGLKFLKTCGLVHNDRRDIYFWEKTTGEVSGQCPLVLLVTIDKLHLLNVQE